ncbi:MAG: hypothetical protein ACTHJ2_04720, partial [Candidatus Nitrosocosmicus sp.]
MLLQMIGESSQYINNDLTTSRELANDLRELYDLPPLSIEKEMVIKSSYMITNLNGFIKDYATDSEENTI